MRGSTIVILLGIVGCASFILFAPGGLMRENPTPPGGLVPGLLFSDISRVEAIQLDGEGSKCGFELVDNQWTFTKPKGAPVREGSVERILQHLGRQRALSILTRAEREAKGLSLPELGLDPAKSRIRVRSGDTVKTLLLGSRSAFSTTVYAHELGSDKLMTVPAAILSAFPEDPFTLRDTTLGIPARQAIARVEMDRPEGFFQANRTEGPWLMTQPQAFRLDQASVHHLIDSLASARMEQIVTDEPGDLGQYGLLENTLEFRWWVEGAVNAERLRVGSEVKDKPDFVYAQLGLYPTVFTLSRGVKKLLETPVDALRDRRILPLDPTAITGIRIQDDVKTVTLSRDAASSNSWNVLEPIELEGDGLAIDAMVLAWTRSVALGFPADRETLIGTNQPDYRLSFIMDANSSESPADAIRQIDVYHRDKQHYLILPQENMLAEVATKLVATLHADPLRYANRQMLDFAPTNVLELVRGERESTFTVLKDSESGAWKVDGDACILRENLFSDLLQRLAELKASRLVAWDPPEVAIYGLDRPLLELTVSLRGGDLFRQSLLVGKSLPAGDGHYAMIRGREMVFALDGKTSQDLLKPFCTVLP